MAKRVLILGGSTEARELAFLLARQGHDVITSFAGRTSSPLLPPGKVRFGGFGGLEGLVRFLREEAIEIIADATHPFAAQISAHGFEAAQNCDLRYVRLERPAWRAGDGDSWSPVKSAAEAASAVPRGARVLLTIGRKGMAEFLQRTDLSGVMRMIEQPEEAPPARWRLILARPPFTEEQERSLMREHGISVLVSKNAGGALMEAKLRAARGLGLPVIMIERPQKPAAQTAATAEEIARIIDS